MGYFGSGEAVQADVNVTPMRNVYAAAGGGTLGTLGSASSPDTYNPNANAMNNNSVATPTPRGGIAWWVGILLLVGLMLMAARKTGNADEFKNLRASTYNVLFITLVAILGLTATKIIAVRMRQISMLQGLSDVILAA
jgi:hypothetical protein